MEVALTSISGFNLDPGQFMYGGVRDTVFVKYKVQNKLFKILKHFRISNLIKRGF